METWKILLLFAGTIAFAILAYTVYVLFNFFGTTSAFFIEVLSDLTEKSVNKKSGKHWDMY